MKLRNGFVSNSSSSSFIIGYGVIKDFKAFEEKIKALGIELTYDVFVTSVNEPESFRGLKQHEYDRNYDEIPGSEHYAVVGGNNTSIKIPDELLFTEELFVVEITNGEGDVGFTLDEEWGRDYSSAFDKDFYSEEQQEIIDLLENKDGLFKEAVLKYGAERNG